MADTKKTVEVRSQECSRQSADQDVFVQSEQLIVTNKHLNANMSMDHEVQPFLQT